MLNSLPISSEVQTKAIKLCSEKNQRSLLKSMFWPLGILNIHKAQHLYLATLEASPSIRVHALYDPGQSNF